VLAMSTGRRVRPLGAIELAELSESDHDASEDEAEARRHFQAMCELVDGPGGRHAFSAVR
jgi:hypothetical protein